MSGTNNPEFAVFLSPRNFLAEELAMAGVDSAAELTAHELALIALRFHRAQCNEDLANIAHLGLTEDQQEEVFGLICARGATMRTMLELMIGFEGPYNMGPTYRNPAP